MKIWHTIPLALLPLWSAAAHAVDLTSPATIHITTLDTQKKPVPGVRITLSREGAQPVTALTDDRGQAQLARPAPTAECTWNERLQIEKPGYAPVDGYESLFCGAQMDHPITLQPLRTTVITARGPEGQPAVGVPVEFWGYITQRDPLARTDAKGEYHWPHAPVDLFEVTVGGEIVRTKDTDQLAVTLNAAEYRRFAVPHTLKGKLLLPDGTAAKGWLVGTEVMRDQSGGAASGFGSPQDEYHVASWQQIAAEGTFSSQHPSYFMVVVSPEGLPFVYALNPESWAQGEHALTLTVPAVKETLKGQLIDENGKPAAGVPVFPGAMRGSEWRVMMGNGGSFAAINQWIKEGPQPGQILTDAQGHYSIPLYWGLEVEYWEAGHQSPPGFYVDPPIGKAEQGVLKSYKTPQQQVEVVKDITLVFVDAAGKPVTAPRVESLVATNEPNKIFGESTYKDVRGAHYFLPKGAPSIKLQTEIDLWAAVDKTITLGADDQTITVTVQPALTRKPIRGRLLDADGQPVADATISVFDESVPINRGTGGRKYYKGTTTDAQGRFEIASAPDDCKLQASATDPITEQNRIPWLDPVTVTADHRDLELHAPPAGNVRILLPAALGRPAGEIYLNSDTPAKAGTITAWDLRFDAATHALVGNNLPVGAFHFALPQLPQLVEFASPAVVVEPNKSTTLDLRNRPLAPAAVAESRWMTLSVTADGKPISGVEVALFRADQSTGYPDGLVAVALDLTDLQGQISLPIQAGVDYVAVARVRGKYTGSMAIQVPAGAEPKLSLTLHPTADATSPPAAGDLENRALQRLQTNDGTWGDDSWGH